MVGGSAFKDAIGREFSRRRLLWLGAGSAVAIAVAAAAYSFAGVSSDKDLDVRNGKVVSLGGSITVKTYGSAQRPGESTTGEWTSTAKVDGSTAVGTVHMSANLQLDSFARQLGKRPRQVLAVADGSPLIGKAYAKEVQTINLRSGQVATITTENDENGLPVEWTVALGEQKFLSMRSSYERAQDGWLLASQVTRQFDGDGSALFETVVLTKNASHNATDQLLAVLDGFGQMAIDAIGPKPLYAQNPPCPIDIMANCSGELASYLAAAAGLVYAATVGGPAGPIVVAALSAGAALFVYYQCVKRMRQLAQACPGARSSYFNDVPDQWFEDEVNSLENTCLNGTGGEGDCYQIRADWEAQK